ncbi:MAG TPA: CAP domain-containing protein [Acidimicrobiia bacterium]|nr:CAP domain-containing protein [Acidimicrobiia bacterium]
MRRAMALAAATAAWVLLIQVASIGMAPPVVFELAPLDVAFSDPNTAGETLELTLSPTNPALIVVPTGSFSATTTTTQVFPTVTVASSTTTTTVPTTTTTKPVTTTTSAPVTTTTITPVVTTAPPTTTTSTVPITTAAAGSFSAPAESEFISKINALRSSVGVAGLATNGDLNNYARWWAKQMADSGNFSHSDIGSLLDPWSTVGENIGYGPSVTSVFNALVASTSHYNNMVDPRFTSVGVGAYVDSTGLIWTAHVFGG